MFYLKVLATLVSWTERLNEALHIIKTVFENYAYLSASSILYSSKIKPELRQHNYTHLWQTLYAMDMASLPTCNVFFKRTLKFPALRSVKY